MATQLNNSVGKAFEILKLINEGLPEIAAADLVRELGMNGITAHRFLKTLEKAGALVQVSKGTYRLGYTLVDLGDRALSDNLLGRVLQPCLNRLTASLKEASMATSFQADMVVCIARAVSNRSLSVDVRVGSRLEAYCTAHGKLWLAYINQIERDRYFEAARFERFTGTTVIDRAALEAQFAAIRRDGFSLNDGEREEGIRAVAVPILTRTGRMVAGFSVFGPTTRLTDAVVAEAVERLKDEAVRATELLYGAAER